MRIRHGISIRIVMLIVIIFFTTYVSCIFSPKTGKKESTPTPQWLDPTSPRNVINNLQVAFNLRDIDFFERCLHENYYYISPSQTDSDVRVVHISSSGLVANTTSDAYGDYIFTDIPNGNYQLVALKYTPAMGGKWLMTESDVVIENGTDIVNANLTLGFAAPGAQDSILSLLVRTDE